MQRRILCVSRAQSGAQSSSHGSAPSSAQLSSTQFDSARLSLAARAFERAQYAPARSSAAKLRRKLRNALERARRTASERFGILFRSNLFFALARSLANSNGARKQVEAGRFRPLVAVHLYVCLCARASERASVRFGEPAGLKLELERPSCQAHQASEAAQMVSGANSIKSSTKMSVQAICGPHI